jgi:hypothetical protein
MNDTPATSRKRKRGKRKNLIIEGDDDTIDLVTFEEIIKDTPGGPVRKRVEVPLRPYPDSDPGPGSQPQPATASQTENFDVPMLDIIDDVPMRESSNNKVVVIYIWTVQSRCANQSCPATILDAGVR